MKTTTKLALGDLKTDKSRSLLTGIAIFLTTVLITVILFGCNAFIQNSKAHAAEDYGEHYGVFSRITPEQTKALKLHARFYNIGLQTYAAEGVLKGYHLSFFCTDSIMRMLTHFQIESGQYPQAEDEILAQREFFQAQGFPDPKIGDTVTLPLRIGGEGEILNQEFTISGFLYSSEANRLAKRYSAYVSDAFLDAYIPEPGDRNTYAGFQVVNDEGLNASQMEQTIRTLAAELGLKETQVSINNNYLAWTLDPDTEVLTFGFCIILIIVIVSALVIYNIFHVAVIQKIREFGRLKALGASKRQLKQLVHKEGLMLSALSIPAGIVFGAVLLKITLHTLIRFTVPVFSLPLALAVTALSLVTVLISIQKPLRLAAKTSPIEAIRYEAGGREHSRKGKKSVTVFALTMSNLALHKKRTVTTILTMGLSCVLLVVIANIVGNMDAVRQAREDIEYGRFRIELDCSLNDTTYPENNLNEVQKQNPLGETFLQQLKSIDGVTGIWTRKQIPFYETNQNTGESQYNTIAVVSREDFAWLERNAERGIVDYQNTAGQDGIIYMWDHFLDDEYSIGDTFSGEILDGDRRIPFSAPITGSCGHSNDGSYTITEDTFAKLGLTEDMTGIVFVDCDSKDEAAVGEQLEQLVSATDHLQMTTFADTLHLIGLSISFTRNGCYTFLIILTLIGFMNMANTMVTNILTRKREFGIMQAIGMSNRQLNQMLQLEGLVFTAGTLLISLTVGNILGYFAFHYCKEEGIIGLFEYHVPVLELCVLIVGILALQTVLAFVLSKNVKKESLVERIRYQE